MGGRSTKRWTEAEDARIREQYADMPKHEIEKAFPGRSESAVKQRASWMGVRKSAECVRETCRQALQRSREAGLIRPERFRRPIGSTHEKGSYIRVKVADPDVWKNLHTHVWEQANGPVPEGMFVAAKDGNAKNTDLANLCLRTFSEHQLRRNYYNKDLPEEIIDILHLQNELKKEIKRKTKHEK